MFGTACLHDAGRSYLREVLTRYARDQRLRRVPNFRLVSGGPKRRVGGAGFSVAGPVASNTLPEALRPADTSRMFRRQLKAFLWGAYEQILSDNDFVPPDSEVLPL